MTFAKRITLATTALFFAFCLTLPADAQAQMESGENQMTIKVGPRLGIPVGDLSDNGTIFFGAEGRVDLGKMPVVANASFDYYLTDVDNVSYIAIDLNALYKFEVNNQSFEPYGGGGIGITRVSFDNLGSDTEIGLNLVGGASFPLESLEPFAQLNVILGGDAQRFGITGGILFSL